MTCASTLQSNRNVLLFLFCCCYCGVYISTTHIILIWMYQYVMVRVFLSRDVHFVLHSNKDVFITFLYSHYCLLLLSLCFSGINEGPKNSNIGSCLQSQHMTSSPFGTPSFYTNNITDGQPQKRTRSSYLPVVYSHVQVTSFASIFGGQHTLFRKIK